MKENNKKLNLGWKYVIAAYITFVAMVLGICGCASMIFHASPIVMRILSNVCAWSPTLVLFIGFRKWCPDKTVQSFLKEAFSGKIKTLLLIVSILSTGLAFLVAAYIYSLIKAVPFVSVFQVGGYPIIISILLSLLSGPTGEECGWRGYLRPVFAGRYGFLKGNIIVGLVWTFWHAVLWLVDSDYTSGSEMLIYILSNIVVITAIHMIMAVVLERENNLLYAIIIHLFFNLPYCFLNANITFYVIIMVVYTLEALGFLVFRSLSSKKNR